MHPIKSTPFPSLNYLFILTVLRYFEVQDRFLALESKLSNETAAQRIILNQTLCLLNTTFDQLQKHGDIRLDMSFGIAAVCAMAVVFIKWHTMKVGRS